jgi:hypothetical protein
VLDAIGMSTWHLLVMFTVLVRQRRTAVVPDAPARVQALILLCLFVFIFLGISAFSSQDSFAAVINSLLPIAAALGVGGTSGQCVLARDRPRAQVSLRAVRDVWQVGGCGRGGRGRSDPPLGGRRAGAPQVRPVQARPMRCARVP